jgi:hypothetical protein
MTPTIWPIRVDTTDCWTRCIPPMTLPESHLDGDYDHHGRGRTAKDWDDHGEASNTAMIHQADVAATVLGLLGLDVKDFNPGAGKPIPATGAGR